MYLKSHLLIKYILLVTSPDISWYNLFVTRNKIRIKNQQNFLKKMQKSDVLQKRLLFVVWGYGFNIRELLFDSRHGHCFLLEGLSVAWYSVQRKDCLVLTPLANCHNIFLFFVRNAKIDTNRIINEKILFIKQIILNNNFIRFNQKWMNF